MDRSKSNVILEHIEANFLELIHSLQGTEDQGRRWSKVLIARYSEPQRHYHTLEHIYAMLQSLEQYRHVIHDGTALKLAIYFHDCVYDPKANDNEIKSIELFRDFAADVPVKEALVTRVARYIECTISHSLGKDQSDMDLRMFLDFDLEVLSRDQAEYEQYGKQIRQEYGHLSSTAFSVGRAKVLKSFLQRERVYFSEQFYERSEQDARTNLKTEIVSLERGVVDGQGFSLGSQPVKN